MLSGPIHIHWEITKECNLKCIHCYQRFDPDPGSRKVRADERIAEQIASSGAFQVTISGGEPCLVDNLLEVIQYFQSKKISVIVCSNGTCIDRRLATKIAKLNVPVQISFDGDNAEIHDLIRDKRGAFELGLGGMKALQDAGAPLSIAFCLNKLNMLRIEAMARFAIQHRVKHLKIGECIDLRASTKHEESISISWQDYLGVVPRILSVIEEHEDDLFLDASLEWSFLMTEKLEHSPCTACERDIAVLYSGDVSPCPFIRNDHYVLGNLLEDDFKNIWKSSIINRFRREKTVGCTASQCTYYEMCLSGCKAQLANSGKRITERDPRCPLAQKQN